MDPITQGVAGNAIWTAVMAAGRSIFPHKIKIISPRPQELLGGREPLGGGFRYAVRGTLKKLPKGHAIWVLTALGDVENHHIGPSDRALLRNSMKRQSTLESSTR